MDLQSLGSGTLPEGESVMSCGKTGMTCVKGKRSFIRTGWSGTVLLILLAFVSVLAGSARAAGGEKNIAYFIDETEVEPGYEFTAEPGEEITVDLMLGDMTVGIWAGGLRFDKEKLEVLSIVGADKEFPDYYFANVKNSDMKQMTTVASTVEESNTYGTVGFCWIIYSDKNFTKSKLATITLRVKKGVTGSAELSVYEKSDGKDGFVGDFLDKCKMIIKKNDQETNVTPVITPVITPASDPTVTEKTSTPTKKPEVTGNNDPTPVENNNQGGVTETAVSIVPELTKSAGSEVTQTVTPKEGDDSHDPSGEVSITEPSDPTGEADITEASDPELTADPTKTAGPDDKDDGNTGEGGNEGDNLPSEKIKNTSISDLREKADSEKKKEDTKTVITIIIFAIIGVVSGMAAKYVGRKNTDKHETKENINETSVEKNPEEDKTE